MTLLLETTKSPLRAKATRCRNWSLAVSTFCHQYDCTHIAAVEQYDGSVAGTIGSKVGGLLNCSVSHALTPSCCTCWIRLVVGPKVVWSRRRAAAVSLIPVKTATLKNGLSPPVNVAV